MSVNQRDVEASLSPPAAVLTAEVEQTVQLIAEGPPEQTRRELRASLTQFYEAVAKELTDAEAPQHYRVVEVDKTAHPGGVYGGQRIIVGPISGAGTPLRKGQLLGVAGK